MDPCNVGPPWSSSLIHFWFAPGGLSPPRLNSPFFGVGWLRGLDTKWVWITSCLSISIKCPLVYSYCLTPGGLSPFRLNSPFYGVGWLLDPMPPGSVSLADLTSHSLYSVLLSFQSSSELSFLVLSGQSWSYPRAQQASEFPVLRSLKQSSIQSICQLVSMVLTARMDYPCGW